MKLPYSTAQKHTSRDLGAALLLALAALPALACSSPSAAENTASGAEALKVPPVHVYYTCESTNQCWLAGGTTAEAGPPTSTCATLPGCAWNSCFSSCPGLTIDRCAELPGCAIVNGTTCAQATACPSGIVSAAECEAVSACFETVFGNCGQTIPCPTGAVATAADCTDNPQCTAQKHYVP